MKLRHIAYALTFLAGTSFDLSAREVKGSVKDENGKPLSEVVVSDGYKMTTTDKKGKFVLDASENGRFVFISTPSGYISSVREPENKNCFYQRLSEECNRYDFIVKKNPMDDKRHNIVVTADPQVLDMEDIGLLDKRIETIAPNIENLKKEYTFGICLGDIVGYDHGLYPAYQQAIDKAQIDFRHVIGNHDMTRNDVRSHEGSMVNYEDFYGPAWYSFNVGDVHYVVMNNNFYIGRQWFYIGYIDETQFSWLEKDLSYVPKDKKVIVCMHMPTTVSQEDRDRFSYGSLSGIQANKEPLYGILSPYDAVILTGHMHTCTTQDINDHLVEVNVGGLCGAWWCGDICTDGAPAGYKEMNIDGTQAKWCYVGCDHPKDYQMKAYTNIEGYENQVVVNVWDYDEKWTVEYFEDGKKICDMERFTAQDPYAIELFKDPSKYKISWVGASDNPNFFKATVSPEATSAEIKVTDRFGRVYSTKLSNSQLHR